MYGKFKEVARPLDTISHEVAESIFGSSGDELVATTTTMAPAERYSGHSENQPADVTYNSFGLPRGLVKTL